MEGAPARARIFDSLALNRRLLVELECRPDVVAAASHGVFTGAVLMGVEVYRGVLEVMVWVPGCVVRCRPC